MFWLLSGVVIANVYSNSTFRFKIFLRHRFARLYPLHLATLILVAMLDFLSTLLLNRTYLNDNFTWRHFILNIFFFQGFFTKEGPSFNGPTWSVSLEITSYLLFALVNYVLRERSQYFWVIPMLIVMGLDSIAAIPDLVIRANMYFFFGICTYVFTKRIISGLFFALICLLGLASTIFFKSPLKEFARLHNLQIDQYRVVLILSLVLTTCLLLDFHLRKPNSKVSSGIRNLGNLTYSSYLIHVPIQIVILSLTDLTEFNLTYYARNIFFILAYIAMVLLISRYIYLKFENPWRIRLRAVGVN